MFSALNTEVCQNAIDNVDDHAEFNASFEALRVASGPHFPLTLETAGEYRSRMQSAIDRFWAAVAR